MDRNHFTSQREYIKKNDGMVIRALKNLGFEADVDSIVNRINATLPNATNQEILRETRICLRRAVRRGYIFKRRNKYVVGRSSRFSNQMFQKFIIQHFMLLEGAGPAGISIENFTLEIENFVVGLIHNQIFEIVKTELRRGVREGFLFRNGVNYFLKN